MDPYYTPFEFRAEREARDAVRRHGIKISEGVGDQIEAYKANENSDARLASNAARVLGARRLEPPMLGGPATPAS